ncbi:ParA family protein [Cronbergia sp. UHCC 0137]|uniref:tyrosine-protein kinase family protein n=1 Tax=Cronbergia sp. UHCC 0137 TaxID=3110239 RepID=UPI002B201C2C|nr:ParA family protein [Cronbergia sp. UHCC 0137]MEA5616279.1 ParA family protein [Cronbergia sp. UHCC 0137]
MNDINLLSQTIKTCLLEQLQIEDPEAEVIVKQTSIGWLELRIITNYFENKSLTEREEDIDNFLAVIDFHLGQNPIIDYELLTPIEAKEQPAQYIEFPLWSDILMAPEPDEPAKIDEDIPAKKPLIVTFYSFKGGVGRSTALGLVSGILATRNRRVVMVDFDLEAPGISIMFEEDIENINPAQMGVLDYLYQRTLTPEENIPNIVDCIQRIHLQTRGEIFLVPAGEYNEYYIHRLANLDVHYFYRSDHNAVKQLIADIQEQLDPDIILIDARPGFNDMGAIALFDLADTAIICFSPTRQNFKGLEWVVTAARKQQEYQGKPDVRFLLTPVPVVAKEQHNTWINEVENWIEDNWGLPNETTIGQIYSQILYDPAITTLKSLVNSVDKSLLDKYLNLADTLDASLPDIQPNSIIKSVDNRRTILHELEFQASTAQELEPNDIPNIFQKTEDFHQFLSNRTWLILGAKGTGKSLLFRLFVEQPEAAKGLAQSDINVNNVNFIPGHGQPRVSQTILESSDLESYEQQVGKDAWQLFWKNYGLLQLCRCQSELRLISGLEQELIRLSSQDNPSHLEIVSWLVQRAKSPDKRLQATDELRIIDRWLQDNNKVIWLLYDELDAGFGSTPTDYQRRQKSLEALLGWWLEIGTNLKHIVPKIFLREDIWKQLNFTNTGHYMGRSLELRWDEADLWRLVLRQALKNSRSLSSSLEQQFGVNAERLNIIGLEQLRKSLYPLWGERMGRGNKAYTYNWIRTRIADGKKNCFPRSLILLLQEAVKKEKEFSTEYSSDITLRPKSLIDAFPYVSQQRVAEIKNEYSELIEYVDKLPQGERSPITQDRLAEIWGIKDSELTAPIKSMVDAGIFIERTRPKDPPPRVYAVAELYLYGLGMVRKGQR